MMALQRLRLTAWDRGIVLLLILTLLFGGMFLSVIWRHVMCFEGCHRLFPLPAEG